MTDATMSHWILGQGRRHEVTPPHERDQIMQRIEALSHAAGIRVRDFDVDRRITSTSSKDQEAEMIADTIVRLRSLERVVRNMERR